MFILIHDPNPNLLETIKRLVESWDFYELCVLASGNSKETLGLVTCNDLDVLIVGGQAQIELVKQARGADEKMGIILLTGGDSVAIGPEARAAGADLCLGRPFDQESLKEAVIGVRKRRH